jgi:hypothetical protein
MEQREAKIGDGIQGDEWRCFENLEAETNPFTDSSWPGCQFRVPMKDMKIGVNIHLTGRKVFWTGYVWKTRVKIEVVGDGEPSTFFSGWLYYH